MQNFLRSERPVSASSELCSLESPESQPRESPHQGGANTHAVLAQTIVISLDKGGRRT